MLALAIAAAIAVEPASKPDQELQGCIRGVRLVAQALLDGANVATNWEAQEQLLNAGGYLHREAEAICREDSE